MEEFKIIKYVKVTFIDDSKKKYQIIEIYTTSNNS